jgi:hypothetical protein
MPKSLKTLADLTPDDQNANAGTERGRAMVAHSLQEYKAGRSVLVDKNGKIIAGNKTVEQAEAIGWNPDDVIVVPSDGSKLVVHQRVDLDLDEDVEARALAVADNRTSEAGLQWDMSILTSLQSRTDLSALFTPDEMTDWQSSSIDTDFSPDIPSAPEEFKEYDEDIETEYCCPKCGYEWSGKPK